MRWLCLVCATVLISVRLLADPTSLDSLPAPVQTTLKALLKDPKETVAGVETYQWGPAVVYKITIALEGHPYLEAHIGDTGRLVRCDPIENATGEDQGRDDDDQASPSPSPRI
ncbi:MAG: hypothetical protein JO271_12665 [Verrucomicrobia bacterium]|nr:hypothetical protein [Verrucomicrobiota bacterium]